MWYLKKGIHTDELPCRTETDSETLNTYGYQGRRVMAGRDGLEVGDWHIHTVVYGMVGHRGPAVEHRELYLIFSDDLYGKTFQVFFVLYFSCTHSMGRSSWARDRTLARVVLRSTSVTMPDP